MSKRQYSGKAPHAKVASKPRRTYKDVVYHSLAECKQAQIFDLEIRACELTHVVRQVPFQLGPDYPPWRVDFVCFHLRQRSHGPYFVDMWAVEVKGVNTKDVVHIRRLWPKYGPCRLLIRWVKWGKFTKDEIIEGAEHLRKEES